jgi:hypothetical protein
MATIFRLNEGGGKWYGGEFLSFLRDATKLEKGSIFLKKAVQFS